MKSKHASSASVPLPDPAGSVAAASPVPSPAIANKPAPGQTGPKGLAPRTSYSRVNTGAPPTLDAGTSSQKGSPPDAMNMLPQKVAHSEVSMSGHVTTRRTLNELYKAASEGALAREQISQEAAHQLRGTSTKTASVAQPSVDHLPTTYIDKIAQALEYIAEQEKEASESVAQPGVPTDLGPGQGPGSLTVEQAQSSEKNIDAGQGGQATGAHQPPMNPGTAKDDTKSGDPGTGLETNESSMLAPYPVKISSADIKLIRKLASAGGNTPAPSSPAPATHEKIAGASSTERLADEIIALKKQASEKWTKKLAEDAINPAQISAGSAVHPDTSASGESGGAPAGGMPQGSTSLVSSNESAINYTKGEAKSQAKTDVNKVLTEPALSSATDKTLQATLDNTGQAGVKISSVVKTAAARALLEKLAAEVDEKKKKTSMGGTSFQAPPVGGAANSGM